MKDYWIEMADGHAVAINRIWVLLDTSSSPFVVTRVFGVDEYVPPDAVLLYQGHQIASRLSTQARVRIPEVMSNPALKNPELGRDIFRIMCGDSSQLEERNCGTTSKGKSEWSWVTAKLLQTKLRAVAKNSR